MSEASAVYACRQRTEAEVIDRYAADLRAARGVLSFGPEPDPDEAAFYADWDPADRAALKAIQDTVIHVLGDSFEAIELAWIVEETLYQILRTLERDGAVRLPEVGRLEITYTDQGPAGRLALSPVLRVGVSK